MSLKTLRRHGKQRSGLAAEAAYLQVSLNKDIQFNRIADVQHMFVKPLWQQTYCCMPFLFSALKKDTILK